MANPKTTKVTKSHSTSGSVDDEPAKPDTLAELSAAEKFYISSHYESVHVDEIASDIGAPVEVVQTYINGLNDDSVPKEPTAFERNLAKRKHGNSTAVIMTEGASERLDEDYNNQPKKLPRYVFTPRNNK